VSWLAYAFRILFVPIGLFGVALATVSLPSLSRYAAEHDYDGRAERQQPRQASR